MSPVIGFVHGLAAHPKDLPDLPFAWLEATLAARLVRRDEAPDWSSPDVWPAGRIFGEAGEYRWRRTPSGLHAVLLLESGPLPPPFGSPMELEFVRPADLVLWGEWIDSQADPESYPEGGPQGAPRFYAQEIPDAQEYPLDLDGPPGKDVTPRLRTRLYRDAQGEKGEFIRCVEVLLKPNEGRDHG